MTGKVKALGPSWGFIRAEDGLDYFFHDDDVLGEGDLELKVGDAVSFEVVEPMPPRGRRARDVAITFAGEPAQED